jgi:hypothetical protein
MILSDSQVEEYGTVTTQIEQEPVTNPALHALRVFLVKNKRPLMSGWQNVESINIAQLQAWARQYPDCGWGAAITSDTMVIDCDSDAAVSALCDLGEAHGGIPSTLTTLTPRGFHFWFRKPDAVRVRNRVGVMPGIDVRTKGGFVVVPPSDGYAFTDPSAPITEAPGWVLRLVVGEGMQTLQPEPVRKEPKPVSEMPVREESLQTPFEKDTAERLWNMRIAPGKVPDGRSPFALRIALEPQNVTKGTRNAALFAYLCRLRRDGKPEAFIRSEAWRVAARIPQPMGKFEVERIIANAMKFDARAVSNNTLVDAWRTVEQIEAGPGATKWCLFLLLVEQLAKMRPETKPTILLPVSSIGTLMNVHFTQVSKWRRRAVEIGILSNTSKYVRRSLADEFAVKAGFSPLADGPDLYKVKRGRKPKKPMELEQATHPASN